MISDILWIPTLADFLVDDHFSYIKITKKYCDLYYASRVLIDNSYSDAPNCGITQWWLLSIEGFLKIARIGTFTIPDRHKTILWQYSGDTGIILAMMLWCIVDTSWYQVCLALLKYWQVLPKLKIKETLFKLFSS
jgi:hypothetical protein